MSGVRRLDPGAVLVASATRALGAAGAAAAVVPSPVVDAAQEAYRQAYVEGFDAGQADGRKEAERENQETREQLQAALDEAQAERRHWQARVETSVRQFEETCQRQEAQVIALAAELALAAVTRIVGQLHAEDAAVAAVCRETLRALQPDAVQVRVHPDDGSALAALADTVEVVHDPSLRPGDCLLRSPLGDVDAGLHTQLRALRDALQAALEEAPP